MVQIVFVFVVFVIDSFDWLRGVNSCVNKWHGKITRWTECLSGSRFQDIMGSPTIMRIP